MNQAQRVNGGAGPMLMSSAPSSSRELEYLMNVQQVAEVLNVSSGWVRDHSGRKQPHLKCVHVGDLLRFRPSDVKEFIEQWCQ